MKQFEEWEGFKGRIWKEEINTRDFIQENYTPYDGDESFLAGSTEATDKLWGILQGLQKEERKKGGVLDMDTDIVSSLTSHGLRIRCSRQLHAHSEKLPDPGIPSGCYG